MNEQSTLSTPSNDALVAMLAPASPLVPVLSFAQKKTVLFDPQQIRSVTNISVKLPSIESFKLTNRIDDLDVASSHLTHKLVGDVLVATSVTFGAAPFLTVVDKAIVQSAAGSHTLLQSGLDSFKSMARNPISFIKSPTFLMMWAVYAATYSTANSLKTFSEHRDYQQTKTKGTHKMASSSGTLGIFLGTTAVNSGASLLKDRAYARLFGTASVTSVVPRMSYALWLTRDLSVVGSSFLLPDMVSGHVSQAWGIDHSTARTVSQLALPMAAQFVAGPLHFAGLDLYNRNLDHKAWREALMDRTQALSRGVGPVVVARIARIAPGYGMGGVLNTRLRDRWRDYLIQRRVQELLQGTAAPTQLVALLHQKQSTKTRAAS